MSFRGTVLINALVMGLVMTVVAPLLGKESFFFKSLHATGNGMKYWYETKGGFMELTGIPYDKLDCKSCHVQSCDACHAEKQGAKWVFSSAMTHQSSTCLKCHGREKATFSIDKTINCLDVHMRAGFTCSRCHRGHDVHGDGKTYQSMRSPGAMKANCRNCHTPDATEAPELDLELRVHKVHGDKLDCAACHVRSTFSCNNCHFDRFLKTGSRKGTFIKDKEWLLLVNYKGKVTSGTAMSLVTGKKKFVGYGPYFTHSIFKGHTCEDCHANKAVKIMAAGNKVPIFKYEAGKPIFWKGIVPAVADKLEWVFLDQKDGKWVPIEGGPAPSIQWFTYGSPITKDQLMKLAKPQKTEQKEAGK